MTAVWIMSYLFTYLLGIISLAAALYFYFSHEYKKEQKALDMKRHPSAQSEPVGPNPFTVPNPILD